MRRYGVGAALALATALVAPAEAGHERYITLTSSSSGYVDMTFTRDVAFFPQLSKYRGTGSVAGFHVRRLDTNGTSPVTGLSLRGFQRMGDGTRAVPPGRYRIYLLADGPATVRIHTEGGLRSHTTPRLRPTRTVSDVGPIAVTKQVTQRWYGERRTRVPFDRSMVIAGYHKTLDPGATWGSVYSCTTTGDTGCAGATDGYVPSSTDPPRREHGWSYTTTYARGDVIHHYYAGTAQPAAVGAAVIVVAL